jgi:hypothetical protein
MRTHRKRSNSVAEAIIKREALSCGPAQAPATEEATEKSVAEGPSSSVFAFFLSSNQMHQALERYCTYDKPRRPNFIANAETAILKLEEKCN